MDSAAENVSLRRGSFSSGADTHTRRVVVRQYAEISVKQANLAEDVTLENVTSEIAYCVTFVAFTLTLKLPTP